MGTALGAEWWMVSTGTTPETDGEGEAWRATLLPAYDHASVIGQPAKFAEALARTGCRKGERFNQHWNEVLTLTWDREAIVFRVDVTKTRAPFELPITRQLAAILDRRWEEAAICPGEGGCFPRPSRA